MIAKKIKSEEVRVRIAPSPTGFLHVGTARTTLFNFLYAKANKGKFILRIEDTDKERSEKKYEEDILESLKWLSIEWDEGPDKGKLGPYNQSLRGKIYKKYIKKLIDEKKAYYCFCSQEELKAHKDYLMSIGQAPRYSNKCRDLSKEEIEKNIKEGKSYIIRFKSPVKKIAFEDSIRGKVEFDSNLIGDFSIAKDEETPLYNLAVVIDDFEMKITHVIRGEDHLPNTPKQILLFEALDLPLPKFAHLPLILAPDKTKLSKRHGSVSVAEYRKAGYLSEALINFMAFLGWNPGNDKEIYSLNSLIREFSLDKCQKGGAVFNINRLDWINGFYIRQKPTEELTELCLPYLSSFIEEVKNNSKKVEKTGSSKELKLFSGRKFKIRETEEIVDFDWLKDVVGLYQERLKKLSEIGELTDFFFKDKIDYDRKLLKWKEMTDKEVSESLSRSEKILSRIGEKDFTKDNLERRLLLEAEKLKSRGELLWPLRVALSGKKASAGPFEIASVLGKKRTINRLK